MAHQFDSGMFVKEPAWHRLGTVVADAPNSAEALKLAGMDWVVEYYDPQDEHGSIEGYKVLRRSDTKAALSIVRDTYGVIQNQTCFQMLDPLLQDGDLQLDAAVSLDGGRKIAITARIKDGIADVGGTDPCEAFLVVFNSHDGTTAFGGMFTNTRVVCANTLGWAHNAVFGRERAQYTGDVYVTANRKGLKLRHTKNVVDRISDMPDFIDLKRRQFKEGVENFGLLQRTSCTTELFRQYLQKVYAKQLYNRETKTMEAPDKLQHYEKLMNNFEAGTGYQIPGYRGTFWGAYQAVTEYETHQQGRNTDETERAAKRLNRIWFGTGQSVIDNATKVAFEMVSR
jgi:phage/plasmid-like protein (TIGR03299 family)